VTITVWVRLDNGSAGRSQALLSVGSRTWWISECDQLLFDVYLLNITASHSNWQLLSFELLAKDHKLVMATYDGRTAGAVQIFPYDDIWPQIPNDFTLGSDKWGNDGL
jgi:hypothetical protein